ncbi:hypothetical protein QTO34_006831 [Cnephaeus nilssonii]|uniref:Ornithine decarboxylase n=1 Tax=Cnephaeus nilssonii TaxID=3371016 RepID=A0AA40HM49_CNENI|nr:hypothetical protein QTO34_006831 [Eptesicus nilssonii]
MNSVSNEEFDCHFLDEGFTAKDILDQKINEVSASDDKDAFYVADLGDILKKHLRWLKALPRVTPFYAVKCNDSRTIVKTLAAIGTGFDCASKTEIQLVQSLGVPPERIIYANPCKQVSQIKYAASNGVQMMTFDSEVELMKVARAHPKAKLVLRIATDDSKAVCRLSVKFGATLKTSRLLLERAKELNIDVIGVSFHVGSGCTDPETFVQAISDARCVFDMGAEVGFNMYLLDIGVNIIAKKLVLKEQTGSDGRCKAELIAHGSGSWYKRWSLRLMCFLDEDESSEKTFMYYVNDGVYGSFNCILYDHAHVKPLLQKVPPLSVLCVRSAYCVREGRRLVMRPKPDEKYYSSSIWGPTCDGLDRIVERCGLPEMHVGDWMLFENMGAYTVAAASTFNGFQRPTIYYVMSGPTWQLMQQVQNRDFPPEVEEDAGALPVSCAWESGMELLPAACASARVNV